MSETRSREIELAQQLLGIPRNNDFEIVERVIPAPSAGELLVKNLYMSVDPYMRGSFGDMVGEVWNGGSVGKVIYSKFEEFGEGEYVVGNQGWREYYLSDGSDVIKIKDPFAPLHAYLGALGMPGRTAYVGLLDIGQPEKGETVFVSAASGAVGSIVCQIARIKGCRVVGSAGSDEKVAWLLNEARIDSAFNYKRSESLEEELEERCPDGIDVYYDNVGGEHLNAALVHMNQFGRIPLCGMISTYNSKEPPPGPSNLMLAVRKRLTLQGFIVSDHSDRFPQFYEDMRRWVAEGLITWRETIVQGLENAPGAFIQLFTGGNFGKMIVQIADE